MTRSLALLAACLGVVACGSATQATPTASGPPPAVSGCVDKAAARAVWLGINGRLNAIALDPKHLGLADVATGAALTDIQQYIQQTLVGPGFTEREVDTLDDLTIRDAGCGGGSLQLTVTTTLARDDYLKADGTVDHVDPMVGKQIQVDETFVRVGGQWKESDIVDVPTASPSGPLI